MARTPSTPSTRSMKTEAIASAIGTPIRASDVARTASAPTLAGRNVPTKLLTKNTCRTAHRPTRGRPGSAGDVARGTSSHSQRHAISVRSTMTRRTAASSGPGRAPAAMPHTSAGSLFQRMNAVRPRATTSRTTVPADGRRAQRAGAAGRPDGRSVTSLGGGHRRQRLEVARRIALHLDRAAQELRVGHDLLHRTDVDLARAQAGLADAAIEGRAMGEVLG